MHNTTRALLMSLLGMAAACSGGTEHHVGAVATGGARATGVAGNAGTIGNPAQAAAGTGSTPTTAAPPVPSAGIGGAPAAGASGSASNTPIAGSASSEKAGAGGDTAAAGRGADTASPDDQSNGHPRGPDPTEESASVAGPYKVQQYTSGFRDGPDFGAATIYYPSDGETPLAMIVFCPGYLGTQAGAPPWSDSPWGPFMASHGIVFMLIDTNTPSDSVAQRQAALLDALTSLKAENTRSASPLAGKLDSTRVSLMGWSMGGGGAWLNAKAHPELKSIVTIAGHNLTAGGAEPDRGITVPTLMFAGTADTSVLGLAMSQPVYEVIPDSTPKMLFEVQGAGHFDFNDPSFNDKATGRYALSWQKVFLEDDARYRKFLLVKGPKASDFRTTLQ
jgi:dienelactone hydrolase